MAIVRLPKPSRRYVVVLPDEKHQSLAEFSDDFIKSLYKTHGAILFRRFDVRIDTVTQMTRRFCTHAAFNDSPNRIVVDPANKIQSVDRGDEPFPLHPEMSRLPWKPDICWFGCLTAPHAGGETTICDGVEVVKRLPPNVLKAFSSRRLLYKTIAPAHVLHFWFDTEEPTDEQLSSPPEDCPFEFMRERGAVYSIFTAPALHRPMFSSDRAWGNFLFFSRYLHNEKAYPVFEDGTLVSDLLVDAVKKVADRLEQAVKWRKGDLLMLDNSRFMHGRRGIANVNERMILTYFGYLNFAEPSEEEPVNAAWRDPEVWSSSLAM